MFLPPVSSQIELRIQHMKLGYLFCNLGCASGHCLCLSLPETHPQRKHRESLQDGPVQLRNVRRVRNPLSRFYGFFILWRTRQNSWVVHLRAF